MFCPACDHPLHETEAACGRCAFSLAGCDAVFGSPPVLKHPVTDPEHRLSRSARSQVAAAAADFAQRFPQAGVTLLILSKPDAAPLRPWLFWVFNRGGLHNALEKGGSCRRFLLWLDPVDHRLAAMGGYGFEPLLPSQALREALAAAAPHAASANYARAAVSFVRELDRQLARLHHALPQTFGWAPEHTWVELGEEFDEEAEVEQLEGAFIY